MAVQGKEQKACRSATNTTNLDRTMYCAATFFFPNPSNIYDIKKKKKRFHRLLIPNKHEIKNGLTLLFKVYE